MIKSIVMIIRSVFATFASCISFQSDHFLHARSGAKRMVVSPRLNGVQSTSEIWPLLGQQFVTIEVYRVNIEHEK